MSTKPHLVLRIIVMVILALLAFQFELGMAVNVAKQPTLPPFGFSLGRVSDALNQIGVVAVIHASLGVGLVLFSIVSLIFALRSGVRCVQVFGSLALVATCLAATTGVLYTLSVFQNDGLSEGMASNFLLSFTFNFLQLYFLKPALKS
ncbi:MAG: hypothetical protein ACXWNQ_01945 [Anaerolineales bacterium]